MERFLILVLMMVPFSSSASAVEDDWGTPGARPSACEVKLSPIAIDVIRAVHLNEYQDHWMESQVITRPSDTTYVFRVSGAAQFKKILPVYDITIQIDNPNSCEVRVIKL